jgi:hypothetical protein
MRDNGRLCIVSQFLAGRRSGSKGQFALALLALNALLREVRMIPKSGYRFSEKIMRWQMSIGALCA